MNTSVYATKKRWPNIFRKYWAISIYSNTIISVSHYLFFKSVFRSNYYFTGHLNTKLSGHKPN